MTEAEILEETYDHTCSVYRPCLKELESGESTFLDKRDGVLVYEKLKCALSSPSGGKLSYKKPLYTVSSDYLLFTLPSIEIQENDYIVIDQYGHETIVRAGVTDYYQSHNETHVTMERKA